MSAAQIVAMGTTVIAVVFILALLSIGRR